MKNMNKRKASEGSITLEAAIMVPLFIILMLLVNGLFVMFMGQQVMAHNLVQCAKSLAFDPYASQRVSADTADYLSDMFVDLFTFGKGDYVSTEKWYEDADSLDGVIKEKFIAYLTNSKGDAEKLLETIGVENGTEGLDFSGSKLEDGVLTVNLKYTQEYIFNAVGLASFDREITVKVKLFNYIG